MSKIAIPFVLYQLPEAFLLIMAALGLLGFRLSPSRLLLSGLGLGILGLVSRHFLFGLGLHTPVILAGVVCALIFGFGLTIRTAITGCFLSFFLLLMGDTLALTPMLNLSKISIQTMLANPWLHIGLGWVSDIFLIAATAACHLGGFVLIRAPEASIRMNGDSG